MSILLVLIPALLVISIIVCYVLSLRRPEFVHGAATVTITVILITWLVVGLDLPITLGDSAESPAAQFSLNNLQVDEIAWHLGLTLLVFVESLLLIGKPRLQDIESSERLLVKQRIVLPAILLVVAILLLGTWMPPGQGLLTAWTAFGVVWLILLWLATGGELPIKDLLLRAAFLLSGVMFLWLALASMEAPFEQTLAEGGWTRQSIFWALLAIMIQFGAIPLQWWRPINWSIIPSLGAIVHLSPSILGASLLAHLVTIQEPETAILFLITILGFIGLLIGAMIAWTRLDDSIGVAVGLVLAQLGMLVLIGYWVGASAVVAQTRVLILAIGSLFVANELPKQPYGWNNLIPFAALAGLPLTAGFLSLATLYGTWFTGLGILLIIVTVFLYIPYVGAALLVLWPKEQEIQHPAQTHYVRIRTTFGLLIPSLALLSIPAGAGTEISWLSVLFILIAAIGGIVFGTYVRRDAEIQSGLRQAFRLRISGKTSFSAINSTFARLANSIRMIIEIFEGEGGLLWLLIFIVIFWLAIGS
jgi:hypothetical protein